MKKIDLSDQCILITGGAGVGVGSGICEALNNGGATIIINDIDEVSLEKASKLYPML
ncbi:MAG: hypothetical protein IPL46_03870 [Saprospiraceae bacterium]|nr:hypothetical protein [Saprospiraceae bacterium]